MLDLRRRSRTGERDALERSRSLERDRSRGEGDLGAGEREPRPTGERSSRGERLTERLPLAAGDTERLSSSTGESAICAPNSITVITGRRSRRS